MRKIISKAGVKPAMRRAKAGIVPAMTLAKAGMMPAITLAKAGMMPTIALTFLALLLVIVQFGCDESERFRISDADGPPPGEPVFLESVAGPGAAAVYFRPPPDSDVLYIEASYVNTAGKRLRFSASFAAGYVIVWGFGSEGDHEIELCAVNRAGGRSPSRKHTVSVLEPPVVATAKSLEVLSSFSSMLMKWENEHWEPLYVWVDLAYTLNGVRHEHTTVLNTYFSETQSIDSLNLTAGELLSVKISVRDKYDNVIPAKDTTLILLTDALIPKDGWTLPETGLDVHGVRQVNGLRLNTVIDGMIDIDSENFFITMDNNPWSIIIDLGEEYEISRIVTHQRWSGYNDDDDDDAPVDVRGFLYRGENVLTSVFYRWDDIENEWEQLSRSVIEPPTVSIEGEYTILGRIGDMAFIFPDEPQFSKPTRYFRFEAINGRVISEITLYGRKAQ